MACCSSEWICTFLCAGSSIQTASEQFVSWTDLPLWTQFFIQTHRQKFNGVMSGDSHISISVTIFRISYMLFFVQRPLLSPPKIFAFLTESSCIAYGHNIHAILHDTFHWSFLYYQGKLSVNFVYQSAAIWSCYVMLHARHASVTEATPRTSQRTLPQPTVMSMAA
jgi:hypothetical protein